MLNSLSTRLLLAILVPVVLAFTLLDAIKYTRDRDAMLDIAETGATALADSATEEIQGVLRSTRSFIDGLGITRMVEPFSDYGMIDEWLASGLLDFPLLFGIAIALVPDERLEPVQLSRFVFREGGGLTTKDLSSDEYAYWERSWYTVGFESERGAWTEPYRGEGANNVRMVTYSRHFEFPGRAAVVTGDISLDRLSGVANTNLLGIGGEVLVWDEDGRLLVHPQEAWQMDRSLDDLARRLAIPALARVPSEIDAGRSGWLRPGDGVHAGLIGEDPSLDGRFYYRPVNEAGWGIGVYFSDRDFLLDIQSAQRRTILYSIVLFVALVVLIVQVTRRGLRPLVDLAVATRSVAQGRLDTEPPGRDRTDEIGRMARAFDAMQHDLRQHIDDLTRATAQRERIETELETAREIQEMLLPEATLETDTLRVDGLLRPARAVGGDLYLHRCLPDGRVYFAIGDVSDKGVPAALMMARALAVLESAIVQGLPPSDVLATSNETLSEHNELCMFATVLVGEYSPATGRIRLANAGHEHPILLGDGSPRTIEVSPGAPVGLDVDEVYEDVTIELSSGQTLLLYTDGLSEARSESGELYGDERVMRLLAAGTEHDGPAWLDHVVRGVDGFVGTAEPADDLTLLVVHRSSTGTPSAPQTGEVRSGRLEQALTASAHDELHGALVSAMGGIPDGVDAGQARLVVEEWVTNIVKYSALDAEDRIELEWTLEPGALELVFIDAGTPFDPLDRAPKEAGSDALESGGMGILLIQELAESVRYEYRNHRNRMTVRLARSSAT